MDPQPPRPRLYVRKGLETTVHVWVLHSCIGIQRTSHWKTDQREPLDTGEDARSLHDCVIDCVCSSRTQLRRGSQTDRVLVLGWSTEKPRVLAVPNPDHRYRHSLDLRFLCHLQNYSLILQTESTSPFHRWH